VSISPDWRPICLTEREQYAARLAQCPAKASDLAFANLWGWREAYGLEWSFGQTHVWLRQTLPEVVYWPPVGPWAEPDWTQCPRLAQGGTFTRVPEELARIWDAALPGRVSAEPAREHWDYLYSVPELVELKGNRFHKKKNLLSQFLRAYPNYRYHPMTPDCVEDVLAMQKDWRQWRDSEPDAALEAENTAIHQVLENWDRLPGMFGGVITLGGRIAAYTVAEALDDKTLVIHFEKGHAQFKGVYQAINREFLAREAAGFTLVNREQDLGDPGLRHAKESYNPVDYVRKSTVIVTPA
jgi:uncharacterized protein